MNQSTTRESGYEARTRANVLRIFRWSVAWVGTCALLVFGPKFLWAKALVFTLLAVGLNVLVGIIAIMANKRYFEELDELQRRVHLNSLAITVGVAFIAAVPYSVLDSYHMIPFHSDVAHLVMLMGLTYAASNLYGTRRYR
jgi:peptidoglycan/LPS O-acetylase OafA/YrhL